MCDVQTLFRRHGLRATAHRALIYDTLAGADHPTAEELHALVSARCECLSRSTVYATLEAFHNAGLCRRIPTPAGPDRFDADLHEHLHILTPDGEVRDVPETLGLELLNALPRGVLSEIERRTGLRIARVSIRLHGEPARSENGHPNGVDRRHLAPADAQPAAR